VASILKELTENKVSVKTSMGTTAVEWDKGKVHQTGSAQIVFNGEFLSI
jgi:diaminopimelate epimerase